MCNWGMAPSEFWAMTPAEWMRIWDVKRPKDPREGLLTDDQIEEFIAELS